jgi:cyanate lyase
MKEELTTILEAMRTAQAELADYLVSADRNAELTIAKLVGILERREVVRAMRLLRASERPTGLPQRTFAEAS